MNEQKICPIVLAAQLGRDIDCHCLGDACALYVPAEHRNFGGRCAIQYLGALPDLVKAVREL